MGMQCTFSYSDLTDSIPTHLEYDAGSETWTVTCTREDELSGQFWQFNLVKPTDGTGKSFCWFDCGRGNDMQLAMIRFLIVNRICFTCA